MQEAVGVVGEVVPLALRAVAAVAFTLVGTFVELNAVASIAAGELAFGLWTLYMGGIALYAGLFVFGADVVAGVGPAESEPA